MKFYDRVSAGKQLALRLLAYKNSDAIIYAIPRGGVVIGAEIAKELNLPLRMIMVKRIGHPKQKEFGIAAIALDGHEEINSQYEMLSLSNWFATEEYKKRREMQKQQLVYERFLFPINGENRIAIIVDDGIATGLTTKLAIFEVSHFHPSKIVVVSPIASQDIIEELSYEVDEVITLYKPINITSISTYYQHFPNVNDKQIIQLLEKTYYHSHILIP